MAEEAREKEHFFKGMFPNMKQWYKENNVNEYLASKYGQFPQFWQDLMVWDHIKILQKMFLLYCERKERGESGINLDVKEIEAVVITSAAIPKRKKRKFTDGPAPTIGGIVPVDEVNTMQDGDVSTVTGEEVKQTEAGTSTGTGESSARGRIQERKSRWSKNTMGLPNIPGLTDPSAGLSPEQMQEQVSLKVRLQKIRDRMPGLAQEAAQIELRPDRSPSPPPIYGPDGKRKNTREERMKDMLAQESAQIVEELRKLNPAYVAPADLIKRAKPFAKIFVPVKEFPSYNFIGLILGPRGMTQKDMENKTGCRISIRGRGSMRDGSRGRISKDMHESETEDLHVYVSGDDPAGVAAAEQLVIELLKPLDDEANAHKQDQLRQLALINGTLREDEYCTLCGEKGHKQFECPHRTTTQHQLAGVKCSICGDLSHPTRDCPIKEDSGEHAGQIDHAYNEFLGELDGTSVSVSAAATAPIVAESASVGVRAASSVVPVVSGVSSAGYGGVVALSESQSTSSTKTSTGNAASYDAYYGYNATPQDYGEQGYGNGGGYLQQYYGYNQVQGQVYAQTQSYQYAQPETDYDRQWAEYFQKNPEAYHKYLQEQMAAASTAPPPPPPPPLPN